MSKDSNAEMTVAVSGAKIDQHKDPNANRLNSPIVMTGSLEESTSQAYTRFKKPFILALVLQLATLTYLGGFNMYVLATGRTVLLNTVPVDPWDTFRGTYLSLQYDISTIKTTKDFKPGQQVFVVLEKKNPYFSVANVSDKMPRLTGDQVALKGKVWYTAENLVHVHYGLEQYFVPEGSPVLTTRAKPDVEIAVDQFGNATIKQLLLNGKKMI